MMYMETILKVYIFSFHTTAAYSLFFIFLFFYAMNMNRQQQHGCHEKLRQKQFFLSIMSLPHQQFSEHEATFVNKNI